MLVINHFSTCYVNSLKSNTCSHLGPPEFFIQKIKDSLTLKEGETLIIEIPYSAAPAPKVTWQKDGKTMEASRRLTLDVITNMTSICVGHVETGDAGEYVVTLENPFGKATLTINVKVFGECYKS